MAGFSRRWEGDVSYDQVHRPPGAPRRVSSSLDEAAQRLGMAGAVELAAIQAAWTGMVGPQVADHSHPVALARGTLTVVTDHHAWAAELRLLAAALVTKLTEGPGPSVREVAVRVGHQRGATW